MARVVIKALARNLVTISPFTVPINEPMITMTRIARGTGNPAFMAMTPVSAENPAVPTVERLMSPSRMTMEIAMARSPSTVAWTKMLDKMPTEKKEGPEEAHDADGEDQQDPHRIVHAEVEDLSPRRNRGHADAASLLLSRIWVSCSMVRPSLSTTLATRPSSKKTSRSATRRSSS